MRKAIYALLLSVVPSCSPSTSFSPCSSMPRAMTADKVVADEDAADDERVDGELVQVATRIISVSVLVRSRRRSAD